MIDKTKGRHHDDGTAASVLKMPQPMRGNDRLAESGRRLVEEGDLSWSEDRAAHRDTEKARAAITLAI